MARLLLYIVGGLGAVQGVREDKRRRRRRPGRRLRLLAPRLRRIVTRRAATGVGPLRIVRRRLLRLPPVTAVGGGRAAAVLLLRRRRLGPGRPAQAALLPGGLGPAAPLPGDRSSRGLSANSLQKFLHKSPCRPATGRPGYISINFENENIFL